LQAGSSVVIDGDLVLTGGDYTCELLPGTSKSLDVVVSWEGVHLFQDSVHMVAGESKSIPTQKAYRIDCDVPEWCEVKDAYGKQVRFPLVGILTQVEGLAEYSLYHSKRVFGSVIVNYSVGHSVTVIPYGLGQISVSNVPMNCQVRINGDVVKDQYFLPVSVGKSASASIRLFDSNQNQIYIDIVNLDYLEHRVVDFSTLDIIDNETSSDVSESNEQDSTSGDSNESHPWFFKRSTYVLPAVTLILVIVVIGALDLTKTKDTYSISRSNSEPVQVQPKPKILDLKDTASEASPVTPTNSKPVFRGKPVGSNGSKPSYVGRKVERSQPVPVEPKDKVSKSPARRRRISDDGNDRATKSGQAKTKDSDN
jgi:hypothetical protein